MSQAARRRLELRADRAMGLDAVWTGGQKSAAPSPAPAAPALPVAVAATLAAPSSLFSTAAPAELTALVAPAASALPRADRIKLLQDMDRDEVSGCTKCRLCQTRTHTVFGEGDAEAPLLFIGEGPGENEDLSGRPFVGRAGQLLDKMIAAMGLRREQVYIANLVKCRPPGNRVPAPDELASCTPYLVRQIDLIQPRAIVTLGLPATKYILETQRSMGQMRGNWHSYRGIPVMPTYHPAYILRSYNEQTRAAVWSDLKQVMTALGLTAPRREAPAAL